MPSFGELISAKIQRSGKFWWWLVYRYFRATGWSPHSTLWRLPYFGVHSENKVRKSAFINVEELLVEPEGIFRPLLWFEITHTGHIGATGVSSRTKLAPPLLITS